MRILQLIGAILLVFASPAMAKDAGLPWVVTQKSGDVRVIRNGLQPASVNLRASLLAGDVVATGPNGRAMLTRGEDYVVIAPDSRLALPQEQQQTGFTRLIQQVGTMLYKVKRTGVPHFEVKTPMLAAVVKGTTFTVVVDQKSAAVQVTEGVVEVSSLTGDARRLVEGGMTVYIGRERPHEIIEVKSGGAGLPEPTAEDGAVQIESSGDVSLTAITNLTGGLVREAPVAVAANSVGTAVTSPIGGSTTSPVLAPVADDPVGEAPSVEETLTGTTEPILGVVETTVPAITEPVLDIVDTTVPAITEPVIDIVETTVPIITEPVLDLAQTTVPAVTAPVIDIVETTLPAVTAPVIDIVETTLPVVTQPVIEIVETTLPVVTQPVIDIVETTVPVVTQPVIDIVETTVPVVTQPVIDVVQTIPNVICILLCGR